MIKLNWRNSSGHELSSQPARLHAKSRNGARHVRNGTGLGKTETKHIVLVIDRDPMMRETLSDVFAKRSNYRLLSFRGAQSFDAADEFVDLERLDVLVADVLTRRSTMGSELISRAVARHPKLAVVLVSADPAHYAENYPARAVCLEKPFSADQLLAAIDEAKRTAGTDC
jgi:DNA-binding NtrC family response regulator